MRRIKSLSRGGGLTVIFSTHMPQHALAAANEVLLTAAGESALAGPAGEVMTEESLARVFCAEVKLVELDRRGRKSRALVTIFDD